MSIIKQGPMKGTSGKVDDLNLYYVTKRDGTTYAAKLPVKPVTPVRYRKQMEQRSQMGSVSNCYSPFRGQLNYSYEKLRVGDNMRNFFVKYNVKQKLGCYLTKQQREAGFQVLGNFIVSVGPETMGTVDVKEQEQKFVTDIVLGDLQIGPATTQADFARAIGQANPSRFCVVTPESLVDNGGFNTDAPVRDSITLMLARQVIEVGTAKPQILVQSFQIPLLDNDESRSTLLSSLFDITRLSTTAVTADGETRNYLSLNKNGGIVLFTVIHSRRKGDGTVLCSTQALAGTNPMRAIFLTPEARSRCFLSYGGVNHRDNYDPDNATPTRYADPTPGDITGLADYQAPAYTGATPSATPAFGGNLNASATPTGGTQPGGGSGTGTGSDPTNPGSGSNTPGGGNNTPTNPPSGGDGEDGFSR